MKYSNTDNYVPLEPEYYYHIYNRGNDGCNIFFIDSNYKYFIKKFDKFLGDILDVYSYCLLPNHFHFLIRVKPENEILKYLDRNRKSISLKYDISKVVSEQFRRFFISYSKAINSQEGRTGSLFQKNFKRVKISTENYFNQLIIYIHTNPTKHGITQDFENYPYSSYQKIISNKISKLKKKYVLERFENKENFVYCHKMKIDFIDDKKLFLED